MESRPYDDIGSAGLISAGAISTWAATHSVSQAARVSRSGLSAGVVISSPQEVVGWIGGAAARLGNSALPDGGEFTGQVEAAHLAAADLAARGAQDRAGSEQGDGALRAELAGDGHFHRLPQRREPVGVVLPHLVRHHDTLLGRLGLRRGHSEGRADLAEFGMLQAQFVLDVVGV